MPNTVSVMMTPPSAVPMSRPGAVIVATVINLIAGLGISEAPGC